LKTQVVGDPVHPTRVVKCAQV